ncbi:MAG: alkaline phosphatase family protein [Rhodospirillaceae bacterium]|nr:alkaline phosphatase family protein [Rhodospirillaceae bacterium]
MTKRLLAFTALAGVMALSAAPASPSWAADAPHNVILFVPDGLRATIVTPEVAPTMAEVRDKGVDFTNSHSMFPTFTLPNASALSTGHYIGDTGMFGNALYMGRKIPISGNHAEDSVTPFFENDIALKAMQAPDYPRGLLEPETLLAAARAAGLSTAAIGKLGPVGLMDIPGLEGKASIVIDDSTGTVIQMPAEIAPDVALKVGPAAAPPRVANGAGDCTHAGARAANEVQGRWFTDVTTRVILPKFKEAGKPFFLVFWSRDPDGTQHNNGDSFGKLIPGINGETSLRAIGNADDSLRQIRRALRQLGLDATTDIIISADHGFSTIAKESKTTSVQYDCSGVSGVAPGFLGNDLAKFLNLPASDPDTGKAIEPAKGQFSSHGHVILGDPAKPRAVVLASGGSDLIYLPGTNRADLAKRIVAFLTTQDYTSGVFVDDTLGKIPGALPMSAINWKGSAITGQPAIFVGFRSFATDCGRTPVLCAATVADTTNTQGQGQHGSFNRADSHNFQAAIGPSFQAGFRNPAPTSNADMGRTIAHLLGIMPKSAGTLAGRVVTEALKDGQPVRFEHQTMTSAPAANGQVTILNYQKVGPQLYFDAAGFAGRTVGLQAPAK